MNTYRVYKNGELYLEKSYYPFTKGECYVYNARMNTWVYHPPGTSATKAVNPDDVPPVYRAINLLLCQGDTK